MFLLKQITNIAYRNMKYMKQSNYNLKPQDIVILLKIIALGEKNWFHHTLAQELVMSQSEVSQSLNRSKYAGLLDENRKKVNKLALTEFLLHGIAYVFPQQPGAIVRGVLTAHSAEPLNQMIHSSEKYVWAYAKGSERGQAIEPLYKTAIEATLKDKELYELLTMVDAIRVGKVREKELAKKELEKRILNA